MSKVKTNVLFALAREPTPRSEILYCASVGLDSCLHLAPGFCSTMPLPVSRGSSSSYERLFVLLYGTSLQQNLEVEPTIQSLPGRLELRLQTFPSPPQMENVNLL